MIYSAALVVLELAGLVTAGSFLFQHRPKAWRKLPALDAIGFPMIVMFVFLRSLVLTLANFPIPPRPVGQMIFSIGMFIAVDAALVVKLANFRSFVKQDSRSDGDAVR